MSGDWSDPGLIRVGSDYYSVRSTFGWQPGLPIAHSRDLVHWEYIGHGFTSHPKLLPGDTRLGIWGVEMGLNPNTKQFLIYAPTRDGEVFVYYADRPEGPYQVKSLGANLGIDPGFFADDDGRLYFMTNRALIHELERRRPVHQAAGDADRPHAVQALRRTGHLQARRLLLPAALRRRHAAPRAEHDHHACARGRSKGPGSRIPATPSCSRRTTARGSSRRRTARSSTRRRASGSRLSRARTRVLHARAAVPDGADRVDRRRLVEAGRGQGARDLGEGALARARAAAPSAVGRVRRPRARPPVVLHLRSGLLGPGVVAAASGRACCASARSRGISMRSRRCPASSSSA